MRGRATTCASAAALVSMMLAWACLISACSVRHVQPYSPRERQWEAPEYAASDTKLAHGSLWSEATPGLFEDHRARRVGDTVVIQIDEDTAARGDASTNTARESESSASITGMLGLVGAISRAVPDLNLENLLNMVSESEFTGDAQTVRRNKVRGTISVHVRRVMPNGDLYVEGAKVVLVNNEELHMYVSGVVRPVDVSQDNMVSSSRIADAQVELTGRGDLSDNQRPGWLTRIWNKVNPI